MSFWRKLKPTAEERVAKRIETARKRAAKHTQENHETLLEAIAMEEGGLCYFCGGNGSYHTWYDDGTVKIDCRVCKVSGKANTLTDLRKLIEQGTAFDPKELRRSPRAIQKALAGKLNA